MGRNSPLMRTPGLSGVTWLNRTPSFSPQSSHCAQTGCQHGSRQPSACSSISSRLQWWIKMQFNRAKRKPTKPGIIRQSRTRSVGSSYCKSDKSSRKFMRRCRSSSKSSAPSVIKAPKFSSTIRRPLLDALYQLAAHGESTRKIKWLETQALLIRLKGVRVAQPPRKNVQERNNNKSQTWKAPTKR